MQHTISHFTAIRLAQPPHEKIYSEVKYPMPRGEPQKHHCSSTFNLPVFMLFPLF